MKTKGYIVLGISIIAIILSIYAITQIQTQKQVTQGIQGIQGEPGISEYEIIESSIDQIPGKEVGSIEATCISGKKVLGGGCFSSLGTSRIFQSNPIDNKGTGWRCVIDNIDSIGSTSVQAWAICADIN